MVCVWGGLLLHSSLRAPLKYPVLTVIIHTAKQWRWIAVHGKERSLGECRAENTTAMFVLMHYVKTNC